MKVLSTLLTLFFICSCTKEQMGIVSQAYKDLNKTTTVTGRPKLAVQLLLNINDGPENTADGIVKVYDDAWSTDIGNEDSKKIFDNPDEDMAINENDTLLMIEGKPLGINDTTKLKIWDFTQKSYYLKIATSNFPLDYSATIEDKYLATSTSLELNATVYIPFDGLEDVPERFLINIKKQ